MGAAKDESQKILEKLDELPTLPAIVYELSRVIQDPMASTGEIEKIMANDQSMTIKVLKLANSAYYAIPGGVSSLQRAIAYIGYDAIEQLVLSASIVDALKVNGPSRFDLNQFWKHSVGVAMAAETVARFTHYKAPSDLFTCGLIHDMGKVAIYIVEPEIFLQTAAWAKSEGISVADVEAKYDLPRHEQIGHSLAVRWRLPSQIQAVVRWHHEPDQGRRPGLSSELNNVVDIVCLSNLLIHALQFGYSGHEKRMGVPKALLERMYIDPKKLKELIAKIKETLASADGFLKIIGG